MLILSLALVAGGIVALYFGGELLVDHAKSLAHFFGMSAMAIGLTVVAFATSAPELAAAISANLRGSPDLAVGNAVGSNIANVGLILGTCTLFFVLPAARRFLRREFAFMIAVTVISYPLMLTNGQLGRIEGAVLLVLLAVFLFTLLRDPEHQHVHGEQIDDAPLWRSLFGVAIGIGLLVGGAQALVIGASDIARDIGISERIIGLTLLAIGTSLPELAASLAAGRKGEVDIVLGNIIGSNIFNILCILGTTALISPLPVAAEVLRLDFWVMLGISLLLLIFMSFDRKPQLTRPEGLVLLIIYTVYSIYLFMA